LQKAEKNFRNSLNNLPLGVRIVSTDGKLLYANKAILKIYGFSSIQEMKNTPVKEWYTPESYIEHNARKETRQQGKRTPSEYEISIIRRDGEVRQLSVFRENVFWNGQEQHEVIYEDITERVQAKEALLENEERLSKFLESSTDGFYLLDTNCHIIEVNNAVLGRWGLEREAAIGKHILDILPDVKTRGDYDRYLEVMRTGIPYHFKICVAKKYGEIYLNVRVFKVNDGLGIAAEDITKRVKAEGILLESERFSTSLLENAPYPVVVFNPDISIKYVNPAFEELTGYTLSELNGVKSPFPWWTKYTSRKHISSVQESIPRAGEGHEEKFRKKSGELFWVKVTSVTISNEGKLDYYLSNWVDITKRILSEQVLRDSQERLNKFLESSTDGVMLMDSNLNLLEVNNLILKNWGLDKKEDAVKKNLLDFVSNAVETGLYEKYMHVIKSGKSCFINNWISNSKNGPRNVNVRAFRVGDGLGVITTDITEQRQAEDALRKSENLLRLLLEQVPCQLWTTDVGLHLTSSTGMELVRLNPLPCNVMGMTLSEYFQMEDSEHPSIVAHEQALAGSGAYFEVDWGGRILHCHVQPLRNAARRIIGVVGAAFDVTENKRAEEELRDLSRRLVDVQEKERRALSREMHDQIGQYLTGLKLQLAKALHTPEVKDNPCVVEAKNITKELMSRVRNLSLELRPSMLDDLGLLPTLLWHFERYTEQTGVHVNFRHRGLNGNLHQEVATSVYRIVQEALNNVARHAEVDRVMVRVWADHAYIGVRVEDKGKGFDLSGLFGSTSVGLNSMRERVNLLDGKLTIETAPGQGTRVTAEIPLNHEKDSNQ